MILGGVSVTDSEGLVEGQTSAWSDEGIPSDQMRESLQLR